jgi:hypothetical protein
MRIAGHNNKIESNQAPMSSQSFGIGDASVIIEILRNRLYEHKIRTLVQEYMSNARDAHREVGQTRPIEVVCPTTFEPTFKVRDFGPGISPDRMANVFVNYGSSTKRDTNTQTGGFGIGAKSAWSYADGFIIVSTFNGKRRTYHAHVGANNVGQLDLIEEIASLEPNGTEIQVAVNPRDINEFQNSVLRACYFWADAERPVLKGITAPQVAKGYDLNNLSVIDSNLLPAYLGGRFGRADMLVVDGIPYVLDHEMQDKVSQFRELRNMVNGSLIIKVPNGLVQVSASREKLDDSDFTRKGLGKIALKLINEVQTHIDAKIKSINSVKSFVEVYHSMYKSFVMSNSEYQGFKFDGQFLLTDLLRYVNLQRVTAGRGEKINFGPAKGIPFDSMDRIYLVTKDEGQVTTNRRIREYLKANKEMYIIRERSPMQSATPLTQDQIDFNAQIPKAVKKLQKVLHPFLDFHSLPFTIPPRAPKAAKAAKMSSQQTFHKLTGYGRDTFYAAAQDLVTKGKTHVYMLLEDWQEQKQSVNPVVTEFKDSHDNASGLVFIAVSRTTADIIEGQKGFVKYADWFSSLTITQELRRRMMNQKTKNTDVINTLSRLDGVKIKFLTKMVEKYTLIKAGKYATEVPEILVKKFKDDSEYAQFLADDETLTSLIKDKYPLIGQFDRYTTWKSNIKEELTWYLNNR